MCYLISVTLLLDAKCVIFLIFDVLMFSQNTIFPVLFPVSSVPVTNWYSTAGGRVSTMHCHKSPEVMNHKR